MNATLLGAVVGTGLGAAILWWFSPADAVAIAPARVSVQVPVPTLEPRPKTASHPIPDSDPVPGLAAAVEKGKGSYFALLSTRRPDDNTWIWDYCAAGSDRGRVLLKLFSEVVPGTEETYASRIAKIQATTWGEIRDLVEPGTFEELRKRIADPLAIETPGDPLRDYCRSRGCSPP